jgi:hypothetical protein
MLTRARPMRKGTRTSPASFWPGTGRSTASCHGAPPPASVPAPSYSFGGSSGSAGPLGGHSSGLGGRTLGGGPTGPQRKDAGGQRGDGSPNASSPASASGRGRRPKKGGGDSPDPSDGDGGDGRGSSPGSQGDTPSRALNRARKTLEELKARKKVKEADTLKLPGFPTPQQYRAWRVAVRNEIVSASGQGQKAVRWALRQKPRTPPSPRCRTARGSSPLTQNSWRL